MIWSRIPQDVQQKLARIGADDFDAGSVDLNWVTKARSFFHDLFALSDSTITAEDRYDPILLMPELSCTGSFIAYDLLRSRTAEGEGV